MSNTPHAVGLDSVKIVTVSQPIADRTCCRSRPEESFQETECHVDSKDEAIPKRAIPKRFLKSGRQGSTRRTREGLEASMAENKAEES